MQDRGKNGHKERLAALVAQQREALGEEFAAVLLATPTDPVIRVYCLLELGCKIWPDKEDVQKPDPSSGTYQKDVGEILSALVEHGGHITEWTSDDIIAINGPHTDIFVVKPKWRAVYLAVAAWYQQHQAEFTEPTLPDDPAKRLGSIIEQIKNPGPLDMEPVIAWIKLEGWNLGAEYVSQAAAPQIPVSALHILMYSESYFVAAISDDQVKVSTPDGEKTYRFRDPRFMHLVNALQTRREALQPKWPPDCY